MPVYLYVCKTCDQEFTATMTIAKFTEMTESGRLLACDDCGSALVRRYTPPPFTLPTEGHYSPTVGGYVSGDRDLREQLKAASEAASARTGIPHDFKPVDMRDTEALGVTGDGMETVVKRMHDEGRPMKLPKSLGV